MKKNNKLNTADGNKRSGKKYRVRDQIPVNTGKMVGRACEIWLKKRGLDILNNR